MRAELVRWSWPLPWWLPASAFLVTATATAGFIVAAGSSWAFVSLPLLSGMPRASVAVSGPLAAATTAWVTARLLDPAFPAGSASAARRPIAAPLAVVGQMALAAGGGHLVGGALALGVLAQRAAGGSLDTAELVLGPLEIMASVLVGAIVGREARRWWAPAFAALAVLAAVYLLPLAMSGILPRRTFETGQTYLFLASTATQHPPLRTEPWLVVIVMWGSLVLTWLGVFLLRSAQACGTATLRQFGLLTTPLVLALVCSMEVAATGAPIYGALPPVAPVCRTEDGVRFCTAPEEAPVLDELIAAAAVPLGRAGEVGRVDAVISVQVANSHSSEELTESTVVVPVTAERGVENVRREVAGALSGLLRCDQNPSDEALGWSLTFAMWLADDPDLYALREDPLNAAFLSASGDAVHTWYAAHRSSLVTCTYEGAGP